MQKVSFKWWLLQSSLVAIAMFIAGIQTGWKSIWFFCGLSTGMSVFNLLGWLGEKLDEARLELNQEGFHSFEGNLYRLVADEELKNE